MTEWADRLGCVSIAVSEHHGSADGYLPSPIPMLAAMAARTTNVHFMIAALIAPFHDPLRLAEDMIFLDNLSRGRVDLIVAGGYVHEEFAMFDVAMSERARRVTETVTTLKAAFTGEPFEYRGRTVHLTPAPFRPGGPSISLGRQQRAGGPARGPHRRRVHPLGARGVGVLPRRGAGARSSRPGPQPDRSEPGGGAGQGSGGGLGADGPVLPPRDPGLRGLAGPGRRGRARTTPWPTSTRCVPRTSTACSPRSSSWRSSEAAVFPFAMFHPLCGGMPIDLAWSSLHLFEQEVLPAFA